MNRPCDAHKCIAAVAPGRFMCSKHWRLVPLAIQQTINRQYRAGRAGYAFLRDPIYLQACIDAIRHVATVEGRDVGLDAGVTANYNRLLQLTLKQSQKGGAA